MESFRGQYNIISLLMSRTIEKKRSKISTFLVTLRQMLNNQPPQYISWGSEQNSFKIKNPSRFSQEVLPKYFKHSNLSSFIRQLNIYNFKKVSNEKYPDEYIYSHPYFDKNRPELMKNIYRKVHHLPTKNSKSNHDDLHDSSDYEENSTIFERKKLRQEIDQLEQKLSELQSRNTTICEQNLQLQGKIPLVKNINGECSKFFYKILMQSYQVQYMKFAEKIQNQLVEKSTLLGELYQRQKYPETSSSRFIDTISKHSMDIKTKLDTTNYNSTSSGGSLNGHSSRQKQHYVYSSNDKLSKKSDKKNQALIRDQNNVKFTNTKIFRDQYNGQGIPEIERYLHENNVSSGSGSSQRVFDEKIENQLINKNKEYNNSEQQIQRSHNRCVIALKNRWNQEKYDQSKIYKAVVLNPNQFIQKPVNFNPMLYST